MQSGIWEIIADTLYWIQLVWVLSGFALMAYLALRVFPWRDETKHLSSSARALPWQPGFNRPIVRTGGTVVAGSYRFDWNYPRAVDQTGYDSRK